MRPLDPLFDPYLVKMGGWQVKGPFRTEKLGSASYQAFFGMTATKIKIFTSRVSGRGNKMFPSVRPSVSTLMAEPFDIWTSNLVQGCTLTISRTSLLGKVKG